MVPSKLGFLRELTATIKNLTDKMVTLSGKLVAAAKTGRQTNNAPPGFDNDANKTGSAANSDGVFIPTKKVTKGKKTYEYFVSKQKCGHCGKLVNHLPEFCTENPRCKAIKEAEAVLAKAKADAGARRCKPAGGYTVTNNSINICDKEPPGCANPPR